MGRKPAESKAEKLFYNINEASKILGVRPHDFSNLKKTLTLDKITEQSSGFSKKDLEFWKFIFDQRKNGLTAAGIKKEIEIRQSKENNNGQLINQLLYLKSWLSELERSLKVE